MKFFKKIRSKFNKKIEAVKTFETKDKLEGYGFIKGEFSEQINSSKMNSLNKLNKNKFPHYNFPVNVNGQDFMANINIKSRDVKHPDLLVFYTSDFEKDIINKAPFLEMQKQMNGAEINPKSELTLDYLRDNYFDLKKLQIVKDGALPEDQVLNNLINKYLTDAKNNKDDIAIWGFLYQDNQRKGIHDIHMNQGSTNGSKNFIRQDGAFMVCNDKEIKFLCFLVFSSQCLKTDDSTGNCQK